MATFVKAETTMGEIYYLNVDRMTKIHPMRDGGALITFDRDNTISVRTEAMEILQHARPALEPAAPSA